MSSYAYLTENAARVYHETRSSTILVSVQSVDSAERSRQQLSSRIFGERAAVRVGLALHPPHPMSEVSDSVTRGSLCKSALVAGGTQSFHLSAQHNHSLGNAFVLLRDSCDRPRDRALVDKALKLFVSTQAQQLFAAGGCGSLPQIEQNNFE